jgi:pimeloyl-ACP methyl ester carboxylesterase
VTTFVLVHGAFHGAWCWEPLTEHLATAGHTAISVDLPIDDERAGWRDYVEVVATAIDDTSAAILVGHSRAGRLLPVVLDYHEFAGVVYLATSLPDPLGTPPRQCDTVPMLLPAPFGLGRDELGRSMCTPQRAQAIYYNDCSPEVTAWAVQRLRPQCDVDFPHPERRPDLPSLYVAGSDDLAVSIEWMRLAATEILGHPARELPSGHCPFLAVPQQLTDLLTDFANSLAVDDHIGGA